MILLIDKLNFAYKGKQIFTDVNVKLTRPGIYGLIAPNGYGKTTLLNLIAGLLQAKSGDIQLFDQPNSEKHVFQQLCFTQDSSVLYDYLSAYDHLAFYCDCHQLSRDKIADVVAFLDMDSYYQKPLSTYSMGMRQRTLLGIALLSEAPMILMDEPLNGLDPTSMILIREAIQKIAAAGRTVLVSSHNLDEIDKITQQVLFIKDQKVWLEDLGKYRQVVIRFVVDPQQVAVVTEVLQNEGISFQETDGVFSVSAADPSGVSVLNLLIRNGIEVRAYEQHVTGAESRYQELYEVRL